MCALEWNERQVVWVSMQVVSMETVFRCQIHLRVNGVMAKLRAVPPLAKPGGDLP